MEQRVVVIFTKTNARILINPDNEFFDELLTWPNAIVNPDLSRVEGVPPHLWKLEKGLVVSMNDAEKEARLALIAAHGVDNHVSRQKVKFKKKYLKLQHIDYLFYGIIIALLALILWRVGK